MPLCVQSNVQINQSIISKFHDQPENLWYFKKAKKYEFCGVPLLQYFYGVLRTSNAAKTSVATSSKSDA